MILRFFLWAQRILDTTLALDFLAPLALRLYLIPIFWVSGFEKWANLDEVIEWFGNTEWGLGLPFPTIMAYLATFAEIGGAFALLFGFAVRWASIPLMITMAVAAWSVHWINGWPAIAPGDSEAYQRLMTTLNWLETNYPDKYNFITELGRPIILNNGIEFPVTYIIMLLTLFFIGGGRYISMDYWISRRFQNVY